MGAGDWLLLACDGIFDVVSNEEVQEFVEERLRRGIVEESARSVSSTGPAVVDGGQIMVELLQHCLDRGSKDNCTACLVQLLQGGEPKARSRELIQGPWAR